jgi:hypothetical protein
MESFLRYKKIIIMKKTSVFFFSFGVTFDTSRVFGTSPEGAGSQASWASFRTKFDFYRLLRFEISIKNHKKLYFTYFERRAERA